MSNRSTRITYKVTIYLGKQQTQFSEKTVMRSGPTSRLLSSISKFRTNLFLNFSPTGEKQRTTWRFCLHLSK